MANKFTQSVLERQYKEAQEEKRAKKQPPAVAEPDAASEPPSVSEVAVSAVPVQEEKTEAIPAIAKKPAAPALQSVPLNLDAYIIKETERVAKNKTFYLDQAVIDAVKAAAKRQRITDSKLVNDILRKVLAVSGNE